MSLSLRKVLPLVAAYAVVAALWILLSDLVLGGLLDDAGAITWFQTIKGLGFVALTSLILLIAFLRYTREYNTQLHRIAEQRAKLDMLSQFQESVIDNASVWINVLDTQAEVSVWNKAAEQISGYARDEVLGNPDIWLWLYPDPEYRAEVTQAVTDILDQGMEVAGFETRIRAKSGEIKTISWHSRRFFDRSGDIAGAIAIGQDISARKRAEQALVERERQLASLMGSLPGMAYRCLDDEYWTMQFVSDGCLQLTGYSSEDLVNNQKCPFVSLIHEDDAKHVLGEVAKATREERRFTVEYRIRHKDGGEKWVWEQGREVCIDGNRYLEGIIVDITQRKFMEQELELLATRDALTGLYNRRELELQFREELARAQRYDRPLALLWIDVDHFKSVNDRFGHRVGDDVLRMLGRLLETGIRTVDYAARYGGEELAVVLPDQGLSGAVEMAERLRRLVQESPIEIDGASDVTITISVGVAVYPDHGATHEELFEAADRAMYLAKQQGRNSVCRAG
jgi:diguanylate cyclase (GGDEF)-like protein/PAS domain S-box-containing protein